MDGGYGFCDREKMLIYHRERVKEAIKAGAPLELGVMV